MSIQIEPLLAMLERGQDTALLRFSLGNEYLSRKEPRQAVIHLRQALKLDGNYSAAWKLLGKALTETGNTVAAIDCYREGIKTSEANGDRQAAKEMMVFLKRLERKAAIGGG